MAPKSPAGFLYNFIGRNVADPRNYRFLQEAAGNVLSRAIPQNVNWGGLPTQFLNTLTDITKMAPGAAKESARSQAKTTLVRAAATPPTRIAGQIAPGGALRAPSFGNSPARPPVAVSAPSSSLPSGGPFNIDYALRRATGFTGSPAQIAQRLGIPLDKLKTLAPSSLFSMPLEGMLGPSSPLGQITAKTSMFAAAPKNALQAGAEQAGSLFRKIQGLGPTALNPFATRTPTTRLGKVGQALNPLNRANLLDLVNPAPGAALGARLASGLGLTGAAGLGTSVAGGLAGFGAFEALFPQSLADGTLDAAIERGDFKPQVLRQVTGGAQDEPPPGAPPAPDLPPPPVVEPGSQAGQQIVPPAASPIAPGMLSTGAGVPAQRQNVQDRARSQEVLNAMQQYAAPATFPGGLSAFYAGQQQLGRSMEQGGELQRRLKELGGAAGMTDEALMQWVQANPGVAYRELLKRQELQKRQGL
jgi:hypothetical protein